MSEHEYEVALARIEFLVEADPPFDSEVGRELDALVEQVLEYERAHFPFPMQSEGGRPS